MSGSPLWLLQDDENSRAKKYYFRCKRCTREFKATRAEADDGCEFCGSYEVERESPVEGRGKRAARA